MTPPEVLTYKQAAEYLQVSRRTLEGLVKRKAIPFGRIGGQVRFSRRGLDGVLLGRPA